MCNLDILFHKLEHLDFDNIKIEDINNIIQISNPIYKE